MKVTKIEKRTETVVKSEAKRLRRVAGYARVSTDNDDQYTSFEAQVDYYTRWITSHEGWEFVKVYSDEGISGTSTSHREGFNEMLTDALVGKIDLIVTKSISRFARNTVDSLRTIRMLKEHGVEVFFEKENIYTFDGKGELLLTIMSSLAQEESRSISENVKWGIRKKFSDGNFSIPYSSFLGYRKGDDGTLVIDPDEADTVRLIYRMYLDGNTASAIAHHLDSLHIPTPMKRKKWNSQTIMNILTNEKYKGDALLQKRFTADYLTKKLKVNDGEVQQYYVEESHEPIISPIQWELVKAEMSHREKAGLSFSASGIFASRLVCGECGSFYGRKVIHSNSKYKRYVWRCNSKYSEKGCGSKAISEDIIKAAFVKAVNILLSDKESLIRHCTEALNTELDYQEAEIQLSHMQDELSDISASLHDEIVRSVRYGESTSSIAEKQLSKRYDEIVSQIEICRADIDHKQKQHSIFCYLTEMFKSIETITEWDDILWLSVIEKAVIYKNGLIVFVFKTGSEIKIQI